MSNDIEMQAPAAILMYKRRWRIEVWFKSVKQEINLARFQLQQLESIGSHFQLRGIGYLVLNVVRHRELCAPKSMDVEKSKTVLERYAYHRAVVRSCMNHTFSTCLAWLEW